MEFTGERYIPGIEGAIELEHLNRYYFVVYQVDLSGKTILDIASGEGYGSNLLAKFAGQVTGVDINLNAIEYANNKYKANNLKFIQGNAIAIPLQNKSVDIVVSFETIEHHDKHVEMISEIKRVLKPEGILIISSPDKQHFINFPENIYHVKELFYEEFKGLMSSHFSNTFFYSQRIFAGSMIALDYSYNEYRKPLIVNKDGTGYEFDAVYNIAICTDNINYKPINQLVLFKKTDNILTEIDIEKAKQSMRNKKAYRVGKIILKPFSYLRNKFNK